MAVSFTGHRKIEGAYYPGTTKWTFVFNKTMEIVYKLFLNGHDTFITGGAIGFDSLAADVVVELKNKGHKLKLILALPFEGFNSVWPEKSKQKLISHITNADKVHYVSLPGYSPKKMQDRNQFMVDNSVGVIAMYIQGTTGGTANCVKYVMSKKKPLIIINPLTCIADKIVYNATTNTYNSVE